MGKRHGAIKGGRILRRGNNAGTLYRKHEGGIYFMRFSERTPDGRRIRKVMSTGTADLDAARDVLNAKQKELGFGESDERHIDALLTARRNLDNERIRLAKERAEREAIAKREAEDAAQTERDRNAVTFAEAFVIFRTSKRRPDSGETTLSHYESEYNRFTRWIAEVHPEVTKMRDFSPSMAEEFITHIEQTLSRNSRNKYLVFLRMFWRVLRWEPNAQLALDPWDGIRTLTQTPDEVIRKELTIEELARVAAVIQSGEPLPIVREKGNAQSRPGSIRDAFTYRGESIRDELRRLFVIGIYTGQRLGDCALLDWGEVDLVRGIIHLTPRKTKRKYNREVIVPMHRVLVAVLSEIPMRRHKGPVLPTVAEMYSRCGATLSRTIQAILRKAGIETDAQGESGTRTRTVAGFHSLRHTFSSVMLNAGVSPALVDGMLCHSKSSMTMRYFHEHADALLAAVSRLPTLPQLAADAKAIGNAPRSARARTPAAIPCGTADASCDILDAIRANLDGATAADLRAAVKFINAELKKRGGKR